MTPRSSVVSALFATALASCAAPKPPAQRSGPLAPGADSVLALNARVRCVSGQYRQVADDTALHGPLTGCRASLGDTLRYFYADPEGVVAVAGREWSVTTDRVRVVADSLQQALTARYGMGEPCRYFDEARVLVHRQWALNGRHLTVLADSTTGLGLPPWIGVEQQLGRARCDNWKGVPRER